MTAKYSASHVENRQGSGIVGFEAQFGNGIVPDGVNTRTIGTGSIDFNNSYGALLRVDAEGDSAALEMPHVPRPHEAITQHTFAIGTPKFDNDIDYYIGYSDNVDDPIATQEQADWSALAAPMTDEYIVGGTTHNSTLGSANNADYSGQVLTMTMTMDGKNNETTFRIGNTDGGYVTDTVPGTSSRSSVTDAMNGSYNSAVMLHGRAGTTYTRPVVSVLYYRFAILE